MYKLLLIEDEQLTREGVARFILNSNTGFEVVGEASDGEQGLQLVKDTNPEVIITDIFMPKMNGLDLIENVREFNPDIKIVIISGHDDFKYAQRAIQLGVQEYILKPVLPDQIREILLKTRDELDRRKNLLLNIEDLKSRVLESLPILRERFFNELIAGNLKQEQVINKLRYLDIDMTGDLFSVILLKIKNYMDISDTDVRKEDLLQYFLINIMNEVFGKNIIIYPFPVSDDQIVLIACIKQMNSQSAFITLNQNASRIVASLQKYLNVTTFTSIGKLYSSISEIAKSYNEAAEAMTYTFSKDSGYVINYEDIRMQNQILPRRPADLENQLVIGVKIGDRPLAVAAMERVFENYSQYAVCNPRLMKAEIFELVMVLSRSMEETGFVMNDPANCNRMMPYDQIQKCDTLEELKKWLSGFIDTCIKEYDKVHLSRSASTVEKMKEYIHTFLHNEDFSLGEIAAKLFMSPNYLRQIFKQHTGESFVDYLTAARMEKAAILLKDKSSKVQDISEKVGYTNQRYFASCFKKFHKLTPTELREVYDIQQHK